LLNWHSIIEKVIETNSITFFYSQWNLKNRFLDKKHMDNRDGGVPIPPINGRIGIHPARIGKKSLKESS
jgi:hypothetical protein